MISQEQNFDIEFASQMFKALGDESRIRVLHLIVMYGEMCISDLELVLDFTQTKTSRHLGYLKNSGLLKARRRGQWTFYFLKPSVKEAITQYLIVLQRDALLKKDLETYNILYSNRELAAYKMTQRRFY
jgi:DNA-binding transcriptional ArsR family regulator